jgi:hypothetical protein
MKALMARGGAAPAARPTNPLKMSVRSMYLLKEFGKGERLALPDNCVLEFPDATKDGDITSTKYKKFIVHYTPDSGIYAGGTFRIQFDLSDVPDYPFVCVSFITKYLPDISPQKLVF